MALLDARLNDYRWVLAEFLFDDGEEILGGALARVGYGAFGTPPLPIGGSSVCSHTVTTTTSAR
jgi:hypothetical protein